MNQDKFSMEDINDENLAIAKKIAEEADKTEIPEGMSKEELKIFFEKSKKKKKRKISKKISVAISLAACMAVVVGTIKNVAEINQYNELSFKCVIDTSTEENGGINSDLNYTQIYEKLSAARTRNQSFSYGGLYNGQYVVEDTVMDSTNKAYAESGSVSAKADNQSSYYNTNEQTENVHEGDIIKTDGKYIYVLNSMKNYIKILYADGENTTLAGKIKLMEGAAKNENYNFSEIYIKDNILVVVGNMYEISEWNAKNDVYYKCGAYDSSSTVMLFYNVEDMKNIKLLNTLKQDGRYDSSRLSGNYLYVVSNEYIDEISEENCVPRINGEYISANDVFIPANTDGSAYVVVTAVNIFKSETVEDSKAVASGYAQLYMSEENLYLTIWEQQEEDISDTKEGKKALKGLDTKERNVKVKSEYKKYIKKIYPEIDTKKIYAKQKIMLVKERQQSEIVKLNYKEGKLKITADSKVDGMIEDNLSMDEYKGYLRMVTSVDIYYNFLDRITYYDENDNVVGYADLYNKALDEYYLENEEYNNLYVLNSGLTLVSSIEKLAKNEEVYSARFLGDYGYFVTYENTDPLFSVDFSDIENPQIIGKLKMTGFSDYLHFYSDNLLFGLGMETNSKTGNEEGLKLDMYDISNNEAVLESKLVMEDIDYTEAMYNYKAIMIDAKKNIIGFTSESYGHYGQERTYQYFIFSYNTEKQLFEQKIEVELENTDNQTRGLYIGDKIYIISTDGTVILIDMDNFEKVGTYKF